MFRRSVRATRGERRQPVPGDALIPAAVGSLTHAITIRAPAGAVWPWLAQMGAGCRAGWYSYDRLDNGGRPSADRLVPEWQAIEAGTLFPASPGATEGFHVLQCDAGKSLVLGWAPPGGAPWMTWAFHLRSVDQETTRLVVRARGGPDYPFYGLPRRLGLPVIRLVHFIMSRKQLLGIARRAETELKVRCSG